MKKIKHLLSVNSRGFTLVEMLIALIVTGIILTSVATLAYALGTASDVSEDTNQNQARLRYTTLRISELLRHCKLICAVPDNDLLVWRADDNADNQVNINELVWIMTGPHRDFIRLCEFKSSTNPKKNLVDIRTITQLQQLRYNHNAIETVLVPQCLDAGFRFDVPPTPPMRIKFVSFSFGLIENSVVHRYQINSALRNWAGHLLDASGGNIVSDDD